VRLSILVEVVVRPHRRDRDEETEGRRDERLGDTSRDRGETAGARRGHARERVHDTHRGAEQTDERCRGTDRREHAQTPLQLDDRHEHLALHRTLGRVDVGNGDGAIENERLDLGERAAEHAGDVRPLVTLSELDRFGEVVLLQELRELRRELAGFLLGLSEPPPLLDHDGERIDGHDRECPHNPLREVAHRVPELNHRHVHKARLLKDSR
jgi:hypothetical protein